MVEYLSEADSLRNGRGEIGTTRGDEGTGRGLRIGFKAGLGVSISERYGMGLSIEGCCSGIPVCCAVCMRLVDVAFGPHAKWNVDKGVGSGL